MLATIECDCVRELRHDFRCYYHVAYEDVSTEEAIDLADTLPQGSLYRGKRRIEDSWTDQQYLMASIIDALDVLACGMRWEREPIRMMRPADMSHQQHALKKARKTRQKIEQMQWEEVADG